MRHFWYGSSRIRTTKDTVPDKAGNRLVAGNVARIYYGQAQNRDLLARRQHILSADSRLDNWPSTDMTDFGYFIAPGSYRINEVYEHDSLSLSQWKTIYRSIYNGEIVPTCFGKRALIDMDDPNTFHKLMCDGVSSFAIQWAYWDSSDKQLRWFPSDDPDGNPSTNDSHFVLMHEQRFGIYFNIPESASISTLISKWEAMKDGNVMYSSGKMFSPDFYPEALKFTFRLYDSKGVIENGREFTHIVYLGG